MKQLFKTSMFIIAISVALVGCAINTTIKPVAMANEKISDLCIKNNPDVFMAGFLPELESQIKSYGITTRIFDGPTPMDCKYRLEYTANWQWDLAMYLSYAQLKVYNDSALIGEAEYDARYGGGRMDKFGPTANKLKTLTQPLFQ